MNRAFSAVFHFRDEFSRMLPVDTLCIAWKTGTGFLVRTRFNTAARRLERRICTWLSIRAAQSVWFFPKFPLLQGAYCYYWFYMFSI